MGKRLRYFGAGLVSTAVLGGVTAAWHRHSLLMRRQADLILEKDKLEAELLRAKLQAGEEAKEQDLMIASAVHRKRTVEALWDERLRRYDDANVVQMQLLDELPLALKVLRGVRAHYAHMTQVLPSFLAFEHGASKLHDLALLMSSLRRPYAASPGTSPADDLSVRPTIGNIVEEIEFMFQGEPLVSSVCLNVRLNSALREEPRSIEELSGTLALAMHSLRSSVDEREAKLRAERQQAEESMHPPSNLPHRTLRSLLRNLYVGEQLPAVEPEEDSTVRRFRSNAALHVEADVKAAVGFVQQLVQATDQLPVELRSAEDVVASRSALLSWQRAAVSYLVQQQANTALEAFHTVLQYSFIDPNAGQ